MLRHPMTLPGYLNHLMVEIEFRRKLGALSLKVALVRLMLATGLFLSEGSEFRRIPEDLVEMISDKSESQLVGPRIYIIMSEHWDEIDKNGPLNYKIRQWLRNREIFWKIIQMCSFSSCMDEKRMIIGALKFTTSNIQDDRDIVLNCVKIRGYSLKNASPELRNDREIVLAAVRNSGYALKFASPELQNDPELVRIANET